MSVLPSLAAASENHSSFDSWIQSTEGLIALSPVALLTLGGWLLLLKKHSTQPLAPKLSGSSWPAPRWSASEILLLLFLWALLNILAGGGIAEIVLQFKQYLIECSLPSAVVESSLEVLQVTLSPLSLSLVLLSHLICVAVGILLLKIHGHSPRDLGFDFPRMLPGLVGGASSMLLLTPIAILSSIGSAALLQLLGFEAQIQHTVQLVQQAITNDFWLLQMAVALTAVIGAPLYEEFLFRGLLFRLLLQKVGLTHACWISALLFSLIHWNLMAMLPIFVLGLALSILYYRTGNLWACVGLHAAFNGSQLLLMKLNSGSI